MKLTIQREDAMEDVVKKSLDRFGACGLGCRFSIEAPYG